MTHLLDTRGVCRRFERQARAKIRVGMRSRFRQAYKLIRFLVLFLPCVLLSAAFSANGEVLVGHDAETVGSVAFGLDESVSEGRVSETAPGRGQALTLDDLLPGRT
jgi:hypothetical protein